MLNTLRFLIVVGLAATSFHAHAQDKTDFFGQAPAASSAQAGESLPMAPGPVKREFITNREPVTVPAPATQGSDMPRLPQAPTPPARPETEFQKYIADSTGKILPIFGADYFGAAASFEPVAGAPVPADHPLGVGDELLIRGWGSIDIDLRASIDRNGLISIPTVGSIALAGVNAGDAEGVIHAAIARLYKGVTVSVNFGKLRAITIYVVGQANRPGSYTVSSLSTLVTAVMASGGPNANGSMRRVQVRRGGKVAVELDLYAFIAKGDKSADIKLRDGDTIYIPPATGHVALTGKVNSPAIYELRGKDDSIASLLDVAGGLPVVADPRRVFLERIDASQNRPRTVEQFALDAENLKRRLKNGDLIHITSITPDFSNAVVLRGNVDQPVRAPFTPGMRVRDLIPSREYLITRRSTTRQNSAAAESSVGDGEQAQGIAARIGGLIDEINWDYAVVERVNRTDLTVNLIPFNLGRVFAQPEGPDNIALQPGDTVTIFSQQDVAVPMAKRRVFVRVEGEVATPGVYQMNAGENLQNLVARAGGATNDAYLFGTEFYRERVRKEQQANLEKVINRLEIQLRNQQDFAGANARLGADAATLEAQRRFSEESARNAIARMRTLKSSGRIMLGMSPQANAFSQLPQLRLENGDRLIIPAKPEFVHLFGAVNTESAALWKRNARVADYLQRAGLRPDADEDNIFILRVDGSIVSKGSIGWFGGFGGVLVMPGDSIVVPEKFDKETKWTKFTQGTREWAQIFANFGLGAAAIKVLK